MLIDFFYTLRAAKLKVSVNEYLMLLRALREGVIDDDGMRLVLDPRVLLGLIEVAGDALGDGRA